jgi:adenosylcobinamide kinase/adenosylcobinamide-phosphate guanylyltransferase
MLEVRVNQKQVILVGGGSRSGKSAFALTLARRLGERRLFLATAGARDDEMQDRIRLHRQTRGADFDTVEEPLAVAAVIRDDHTHDVLVVDCLTLWLSNLMLRGDGTERIMEEVEELAKVLTWRSLDAVLVTNEVGLGIVPESALGRTFRDLAGRAHQRLARLADEVYFAVLGTMLRLKPQLTIVPLDLDR